MYNITEANYGFGLEWKNTRFHTILQVSPQSSVGDLATDWHWCRYRISSYDFGMESRDGGWMLPVIGDARYYMGKQKNKFFVMLDGGFLINFEDFKGPGIS